MNAQALTDPAGRLIWSSPALPGAVRDTRAARGHDVIDAPTDTAVACWADKAHRGVGPAVRTSHGGRWETLSVGWQVVNRSHAKIRALGEQAVATLKPRRLLRRLHCSTTRVTGLVQAVLALHLTSSE